jgi:hypothetical protein
VIRTCLFHSWVAIQKVVGVLKIKVKTYKITPIGVTQNSIIMDEKYFVISCSEDGETTVEVMDRETLLERIESEYWGSKEVLSELPENTDTNYWGNGLVIIKGKMVVPKAEQVITRYNQELMDID